MPSTKRSRQLSPCRLLLPTSPPRRRHYSFRRQKSSDLLVATCWSVPSHHQAVLLVRPPRRQSVAVVSRLTDPLRTRSLVSADVACAACSPPFRAAAAKPGFFPHSHFALELSVIWSVCHLCFMLILACTAVHLCCIIIFNLIQTTCLSFGRIEQ